MKKTSYLVAALLMLAAAPTLTSCFVGSYSCLNKMWEWNNNLTGNKYLNAILAYVLAPFEFTIGGFLDPLIFNTIEFWTGSNPMAATQIVTGQDGLLYAVAPNGQGGYTVTCQQTGQQMEYIFDQQNRAWSAAFDGMNVKLFTLTQEPSVVLCSFNGQEMNVSLDEQGLMALEAIDLNDGLVAQK